MTQTQTNLGSFEGIGLNTKFEELKSDPFTGIVVADEIIPNEWSEDGLQWHFAVRPLEFQLGGTTGCFHERANNSTSDNSKLAAYLNGFKKALQREDLERLKQIGTGSLVGVVCQFQRQDLKFGGKAVRMTLPIGKATPEQVAAAHALPPLTGNPSWAQGEGSTPAAYEPPAPKEFTPEQLSEVLTKIDGLGRGRRMGVAAEIGGDIGAALADESIIKQLVSLGMAELDGDVVRRI